MTSAFDLVRDGATSSDVIAALPVSLTSENLPTTSRFAANINDAESGVAGVDIPLETMKKLLSRSDVQTSDAQSLRSPHQEEPSKGSSTSVDVPTRSDSIVKDTLGENLIPGQQTRSRSADMISRRRSTSRTSVLLAIFNRRIRPRS